MPKQNFHDGDDVFVKPGPPTSLEASEAYRYPIIPNSTDSHQVDIFWLAVVIPFAFKHTYDRSTSSPIPRSPVLELAKIFIDDDCISWNCSSAKSSHVSNLTMTLLPSNIDYTTKIAPEDWILFWAFNNYQDYKRVKELITEGARCNDFNSGLKFIGRVQTVFKNKQIDTGSGRKSLSYSLTAAGFSELDAAMHFDQTIELLRDTTASWAGFAAVESVFNGRVAGLVRSEQAIPFILSVCFGCGPGVGAKTGGLQGGRSITPNECFVIPETVLYLLMPANPKPFYKSVGFTYIDLLRVYMGVMQYTSSSFEPEMQPTDTFVSFSTNPLTGIFPVNPLVFNNESIWAIINGYCGQPMNESFTCLRATGTDKFILPNLIFRQLPLSSPEFSENNIATSYTSLPRWVIDDKIITSVQYGYSNALRFNYMQIMPINWANNQQSGKDLVHFLGPPIVDSSDIKRAGLRAKIQTVSTTFDPSSSQSAQTVSKFYNKLMADILFGGHLKYTGTITCKGIQEPICEGDNCEVDGILFHIERIMHAGNIDTSGRKEFTTVLHVGNGIIEGSENYGIADNLPIADDIGNTFERG